MEKKVSIHKLVVTAEAKFDYEDVLELGKLPKRDIVIEIEEYIRLCPSVTHGWYFRVKYYDEIADKMLMLFIHKGQRFASMQTWTLDGVCLEEDWNEDLEYDGMISNWYKTKIEDLPAEDDWVVRLRLWQEEEERLRLDMEKEFKDRKWT